MSHRPKQVQNRSIPAALKIILFAGLMATSAGFSQAASDVNRPVWTQADAERICPEQAKQYKSHWTGRWKTARQGGMSACNLVKR